MTNPEPAGRVHRGARPVDARDVFLEFRSEGLTSGVAVSAEGEGLYRLLEHPVLAGTAAYGDLIRCRDLGQDRLEFVEVVEVSGLQHVEYVLSRAAVGSEGVAAILTEVLADGGFWQRDFGGVLSLFFRPGGYDPRAALAALPP